MCSLSTDIPCGSIISTELHHSECQDDYKCKDKCGCVDVIPYSKIFTRFDYIFVFIITIAIYIPFFISYFYGTYSTWYANLTKSAINPWIPRILWIITTILSYIGLYILWICPTEETISCNLTISILYFIGSYIFVIWSVVFFQAQNIAGAVWLSIILFIYEFWLFMYIWYINKVAALFILPLVGMYLYFVYDTIHLASLNNVPL